MALAYEANVSTRRRRTFHAHPTEPWQDYDWPRYRRWRPLAAFAGQVGLILGIVLVVLAAGMLAGAVLGLDMAP